MSEKNYTVYHLHTELSLQDSVTKFQDYIDRAMELGQTALAFTEHGNIYQWVAKKIACDEAGLKYLHGCEIYLTEALLMPPDPSEVRQQVMEEVWQIWKRYKEHRTAGRTMTAFVMIWMLCIEVRPENNSLSMLQAILAGAPKS